MKPENKHKKILKIRLLIYFRWIRFPLEHDSKTNKGGQRVSVFVLSDPWNKKITSFTFYYLWLINKYTKTTSILLIIRAQKRLDFLQKKSSKKAVLSKKCSKKAVLFLINSLWIPFVMKIVSILTQILLMLTIYKEFLKDLS